MTRSGTHRLLVYAQRFGGDPLAHTPLYKGQVFATAEDRFVQFRDSKNIYLLEFPGLFHLTQFVTMAERIAAGTSVHADDLKKGECSLLCVFVFVCVCVC